MKPSPEMQDIITRLAQHFGCDLSFDYAYLRLNLPGSDPLAIERVGPNQISVAHLIERQGSLVADPKIIFFTPGDAWVPIAIDQASTGQRDVARLNHDSTAIDRVNDREQAEVAEFAAQWAKNLDGQGWLSRATMTRRRTRPE